MDFKIGDKVMLTERRFNYDVGTVGTIQATEDFDGDYEVRFSAEKWEYIHKNDLSRAPGTTAVDVTALVQDVSAIVLKYGMDNVEATLEFLHSIK